MIKLIAQTLIIASLLALTACGPTGGTGIDQAGTTAAQETQVAALVIQAFATMKTETPQATTTPSLTPDPTMTSTPKTPIISVSVDTNCRQGPGHVYDYKGGLMVGETAEVIGRESSGRYWYVRNPDDQGYCWVWGEYATISGDTGPLPVFTPEPTPTPIPDFTFAYHNFDMCGWNRYLEFLVTNTGMVNWESFSLTVRNNTLALVTTVSDNLFPDAQGCGVEPPPARLAAGETGMVGTMPFMHVDPTGDSFKADLTLCTQDNQSGMCLSKAISFTP